MSAEHKKLEEGHELMLDFTKIQQIGTQENLVIPVAVQNIDTNEVILIAYVNKEALDYSIETRTATFWSTSRNELWIKGATSGETFELIEAYVNCEQNSLVYKVRPRKGNICHTNNKDGEPRNCYYRKINFKTGKLDNLDP